MTPPPHSGQSTDILLAICPPWGVVNPPLGLAYLAEALTAAELKVEILDINVLLYQQVNKADRYLWETRNDSFWRDPENVDQLMIKWESQTHQLIDRISRSTAPVVGFSVIDPNEHFSGQVLRLLKDKAPRKTLVAGGPGCASVSQRRMLMNNSNEALDYFLVGEAEQNLPKLVWALKNNQQPNEIANLVHARKSLDCTHPVLRPILDSLPFPTYQDFNLDLYGGKSLAIMWSRGCIGHCSYCKERALLGPYRMRSTENILSELRHHTSVLGITNFVIYDSTINGRPAQLSEICDEILRLDTQITWSAEAIALQSMNSKLLNKMQQAGCHTLVYGIESGSDNVLSAMGKLFNTKTATEVLRRTHKAGIKVAINILVGFPGEEDDDFLQTLEFLKQNSRWIDRLDGISTLQIVDGTPLETQTAELGIHLPETDPHDKWFIPGNNTSEIRQKRLAKVLEIANREGFEIGRTFLSEPPQQHAGQPDPTRPRSSLSLHNTTEQCGKKHIQSVPVFPVKPYRTIHVKQPEQQTTAGQSKKILIATCQPLPAADKPTTGGSLRAYHLGKALEERGHQILYSLPGNCLTTETEKKQWRSLAHDGFNLKEIIQQSEAEIVLFCNWGLAGANTGYEIPSVVDMNGSLMLENHYRQHSPFFRDALTKLNALANTDYIIAGSEAQKAYLTAWCLMAGFQPEALNIGIVPFSLPAADQPAPKKSAEIQFILAGYDWPWLNGNEQLQAVCDELERHGSGSLQIYTSTPPYSDVINENSSADATGSLHSLEWPRMARREPVPFDELALRLAESSVAIDLWQKNAERELAFPSRTVTYLWAGLPVITSPDGELARMIEKYQAGWIVNSSDIDGLKKLTGNIVSGKVEINDYRENVRKLFNDHLRRDKTIGELDRFCRNPFFNRTVSPYVAKYDFLNSLSIKLQDQLQSNEEQFLLERKELETRKRECRLMGMVHRRPKGLAVFLSWPIMKHKLRRLIVGTPVLLYLSAITLLGHFLHILWTRRNRS